MHALASIILEALSDCRARYRVTPQQAKVCGSITKCRTGELGWVAAACGCGHRAEIPCSCRDRHCPTCQAEASLAWRETTAAKLPEVPTYHCVFTVPAILHPLFRADPAAAYNLLFRAAIATLQQFANNDSRLAGAKLGIVAVLHTWGSMLQFHPHLHLLVCGGGLTADGRWIALPERHAFLFDVHALSQVFRAKLLHAFGATGGPGVAGLLRLATRTPWRVYLQRSRSGPAGALNYLGRYSHRVAIAPGRILPTPDGKVAIAAKATEAARGRPSAPLARMTKPEFLRRFLQHVLPPGFRKIRAYGFLARGWQDALRLSPPKKRPAPKPPRHAPRSCPKCGLGMRYFRLAYFDPARYAPP